MPLPDLPEPSNGMVVRFNYRWAGEMAATKDRPACVALVRSVPDPRCDPLDGAAGMLKQVVYLPISSRAPSANQQALEIPSGVNRRLGLKFDPCWVFVSECNVQYWPNDIARIPNADGRWVYGFVPPGFFHRIREVFRAEILRRKASILNVHFLPQRR